MSSFDLDRRKVLEGVGALGASALLQAALPIKLARAGELVAGFVYIGPRLDWGWNESHAVAALALEGVPHAGSVQADYLPESTNYGSGKDDPQTRAYSEAMERLIAGGGARLVISTSFDDDPFLLAMAKKHPDVAFRQASNFVNSAYPPNVGSQNALINQGHYVNGVAAGLCTRTDKLGFVAGMPFGAVLLNVNSFLMGVRQTNPAATVRVIFTGEWEHAGHDAEAVNELVDAGCDVITCHLDSPRVAIETAEARGVKTCGHAFDQAKLAPKGYITGADYRWIEMFRGFVETLQKGGTLPNYVIGGYDKDYVRSSPFGAGATPEAIVAATTAIQAMKNGDALFAGPIKDNTGKIVVPAGTVYGPYDEALLRTDYLVEGVIGTLP
jgi:simple sugar transport system substrate-binding protein